MQTLDLIRVRVLWPKDSKKSAHLRVAFITRSDSLPFAIMRTSSTGRMSEQFVYRSESLHRDQLRLMLAVSENKEQKERHEESKETGRKCENCKMLAIT